MDRIFFVVLFNQDLCKGPFDTQEEASDWVKEEAMRGTIRIFSVHATLGVTENWEVQGTVDPQGHMVIFSCSCTDGQHRFEDFVGCWGPFLTPSSANTGLNRIKLIYGEKHHYVSKWVNEPQAVYAD